MQEKCDNVGHRDQEKEPHTYPEHDKDVSNSIRKEIAFREQNDLGISPFRSMFC